MKIPDYESISCSEKVFHFLMKHLICLHNPLFRSRVAGLEQFVLVALP
jgi:hypothetical protein